MLPFFISLIVAGVIPRPSLRTAAVITAIMFAFQNGLTAYHRVDPRILALPDQSRVILYVWTTVALSVAEVVATFLLVWGIRRFFSSRKKVNK
jgi:hypothetical protein